MYFARVSAAAARFSVSKWAKANARDVSVIARFGIRAGKSAADIGALDCAASMLDRATRLGVRQVVADMATAMTIIKRLDITSSNCATGAIITDYGVDPVVDSAEKGLDQGARTRKSGLTSSKWAFSATSNADIEIFSPESIVLGTAWNQKGHHETFWGN